jgi:tRNA (guanine37-N1)-methyltransferase
VLLSGNHGQIAAWRKEQALQRTQKNRPDLLSGDSPPCHPERNEAESKDL